MLKHHVVSPVTLARLEATVCYSYLDGYTDWLEEKQYSSSVIQLYLFGVIPLGCWLNKHRFDLHDFDHHALERYRKHRASIGQWRHSNGKIKAAYRGAQRLHQYLAKIGLVATAADPEHCRRLIHQQFDQWMMSHRGVKEVTLNGYAAAISALLERLGDNPVRYSAAQVRHFMLDTSERAGIATVKTTSTAVRAFLRYLVATGQCCSSLTGAIPTVADWRLSSLPTYISASEVERLIASCDEQPLTARRDRAVLLLLWRLALRAGDVTALKLDNIDWHNARINVSGKNRREIWLPLSQDVGDAIVAYLNQDRPPTTDLHVFQKAIAPIGPLNSSCVSSIVRRAIERTGIKASAGGAHLIRRSAATDMLRQGATLSQIGSVLRHENWETTQLYAKVDQNLLSGVMTHWPLAPLSTPAGEHATAGDPLEIRTGNGESGSC